MEDSLGLLNPRWRLDPGPTVSAEPELARPRALVVVVRLERLWIDLGVVSIGRVALFVGWFQPQGLQLNKP